MVTFSEEGLAQVCRDSGIARLRIFGSAARGEDRPDSDVDLIADFDAPVGYFEVIRAEDRLAAFFGKRVDLLTEGAISPFIRDNVLADAQLIFDSGG